jgi:hypothetical protein
VFRVKLFLGGKAMKLLQVILRRPRLFALFSLGSLFSLFSLVYFKTGDPAWFWYLCFLGFLGFLGFIAPQRVSQHPA